VRERKKQNQANRKTRDTENIDVKLPGSLIYGERETDPVTKTADSKKPGKSGFVKFCKWSYRRIKSKNSKFDEKYRQAIDFLGWNLTADEFASGQKMSMVLGFALSAVIGLCASYFGLISLSGGISMDNLPFLGMLAVIPMAASAMVVKMPLNAAETEKMNSMTYVPEIVNYLVMSMKLSPNLEKAIQFAAEHGRGKIADDFKKLLWDVDIGVYNTVEEGLDDLAYKWGDYSSVLKHALMQIRASVIEANDARRLALLDKAVADVIEGIKAEMSTYSRKLHAPAIYLYYLGVLLPLMLVIILPIGSVFTGAGLADRNLLFVLYNIIIPTATFLFARNLLKKRPPTYTPPVIPDDFPGIPPKHKLFYGKNKKTFPVLALAIIAALAVLLFSFMANNTITQLSFSGTDFGIDPFHMVTLEEAKNNIWGTFNDTGFEWGGIKYVTPIWMIYGVLLSVVSFISVYLYFDSKYKKEAQDHIKKLEDEFNDAIYVLASRLGENRPMEEALSHSVKFLGPGSLVGTEIFATITKNISMMGLTLRSAIFDSNYGALKHVPSNLIQSAMTILSDSVELGTNVAARSIMSLSSQIRDSKKIDENLRKMLEDLTSMMNSMAIMIAPMVLGITTALQKIVLNALTNITKATSPGGASAAMGTGGMGNMLSGAGSAQQAANIINPTDFLLIIGFYVIELVIILMYFTMNIQEGDNKIIVKMAIAKILPVAIIFFIISTLLANNLIANAG